MEEVQWKYSEIANLVGYDDIFSSLSSRPAGSPLHLIPGCEQGLLALEATRKRDFEDWMDNEELDLVVFLANGDVGRADADTNDSSARHAWRNGVKYSNGNRAIRHLGNPTVTVPMGIMDDTHMPVGLTFVGRAYDDNNLLRWAEAFEGARKGRQSPGLTKALSTDQIPLLSLPAEIPKSENDCEELLFLTLEAEKSVSPTQRDKLLVKLSGTASSPSSLFVLELEVHVEGKIYKDIPIDETGNWTFEVEASAPAPVGDHAKTEDIVPREQVLCVALLRRGGKVVGSLILV